MRDLAAAGLRVVEPKATPEQDTSAWEDRARQGDRSALAELYSLHGVRLRRWVELHLDPRLRGRLSPSDVIQEIYLAAEQRLDHFRERPEMPFAVWVRLLAGQRLVDVHRRHLGAAARDAAREIPLGGGPTTSAANLANQLAGDLTSPSQTVLRDEVQSQLVEALESMDSLDREVLALRHYDELSNDEVASLLGISKGTASKRYVRALGRLRAILGNIPGLLDSLS